MSTDTRFGERILLMLMSEEVMESGPESGGMGKLELIVRPSVRPSGAQKSFGKEV
jgi:hypothetical protein